MQLENGKKDDTTPLLVSWSYLFVTLFQGLKLLEGNQQRTWKKNTKINSNIEPWWFLSKKDRQYYANSKSNVDQCFLLLQVLPIFSLLAILWPLTYLSYIFPQSSTGKSFECIEGQMWQRSILNHYFLSILVVSFFFRLELYEGFASKTYQQSLVSSWSLRDDPGFQKHRQKFSVRSMTVQRGN